MLKISELGGRDQRAVLKLEGRVIGPWVAELRRACEPFLSQEASLKIDLKEVSFIDEEGLAVLHALKTRGVQLGNCSPFIEQQIKTQSI